MKTSSKLIAKLANISVISLIVCASSQSNAAVGNLLWEDNFNNLDTNTWNIDVGDGCDQGICGWGNQELQWYSENNVYISDIVGEAGNKGLVLEAKNQAIGGKAFTSGKIQSKNKLAVQYGMIEIRMKVSDVDTGLWPALWMLGTSTASWPAKGEIDIMEMGQSQAARNDAGFPGAPSNNYTGSNLIFYADAACNEGNPTCAASVAYKTDNAHLSSTPLTNRFVIYRTYWTEETIRFTVEDNGVEYDMLDSPFAISEESNEFNAPFYLLMNLAVGGLFTDALSNEQVSAPLPGKMVVDYVRIYELDGQGEVFSGNVIAPEVGTFGVFSEGPSDNQLVPGSNADIYVWNQNSLTQGNTPAYEGNEVIAWQYSPTQWFGAGIQSRQARDMSNFRDGYLNFKIKIPADVSFRIGIADTYTNENWITFPANTNQYGFVRDGQWGEVRIPITELAGSLVALQSIKNHFNIVSVAGQEPNYSFQMAIDDITWTGGGSAPVDSDQDGVEDSLDQCPNTQPNEEVDADGCPLNNLPDGLEQVSLDTLTFYVNTTGWADVHYRVNGGVQQNVRMQVINGRNELTISGLAVGDAVSFWFTYLQEDGTVVDTAEQAYILSESSAGNDSDGDGVNDGIDQCPDTPVGDVVNTDGCSILITEQLRIEAEDYSNYFDNDAGNTGGEYRNDDVDIELTSDNGGGYNVGWTSAGEWLEYQANLGAGSYNLTARVASQVGNGAYNVLVNGNLVASTVVPATGGWQTFISQNIASITLNEGVHTVRVEMAGGELNLNWLEFNIAGSSNNDSDNDGVPDNLDQCPNTPTGRQVDSQGCEISFGTIVPLYDSTTPLEQAVSYDRGDALITRFADRGRDRHAKEDQFQIYDHYLSHYWTHRTAQFEIADFVAKGGSRIEVTFITEWKLGAREFRAWYRGLGTVAEYHGNYFGGGAVVELDNGSYDTNFNKISDSGDQYRYRVIIDDYRPLNWDPAAGFLPLEVGQRMEFEVSQFLDAPPEGRENYYGTTYLYMVGEGLVPWKTVGDFADPSSQREDSYPIAEAGWLGGKTTLPYNYTNEPDNHFMQMATNLSSQNGQAFVQGRRVHHSSFVNGEHDERNGENGVFSAVVGKSGPHYINDSCAACHVRNGRAAPPAIGGSLAKWVFKVADINSNTHPLLGNVLQPKNTGIDTETQGEGDVTIASWTENNGLRSPNYQFNKTTPARYSARIAPQLVGLGLLEAIPESAVLALADENDSNGDGISGKAQRVNDPITGQTRLGRFGYKAAAASIKHQVASAFNTDMGVTNSVFPNPDCGASQSSCGGGGVEVSDQHLTALSKYIALLGVRAQRGLDDPEVQLGKARFTSIGCEGCHTATFETSEYHPFAELRAQTIHPYTDLLLHDMGPGLADNLGEGIANGAEWRTAPLWGIGLSACVTGGVDNVLGGQGNEFCTAEPSYLHDGRARTIEEAILWHDGEAQAARVSYESLSANDKSAVLAFLNSL
ncbi:di-heme oxidoredictase family protein [Pseudoalteromonas piscicida]|uniref:di-heme oxidoredictase family protein n=1 Tax=Pseudoalteromonas piscicida TaxID=43662 RepID=UPI0005F9FC93|nr:di-heme oxidoredictase family protein [Pseudoalteromonas piscicida]KJZ03426.1 beta-glucanase [Pseudoalteromonas piscicida]